MDIHAYQLKMLGILTAVGIIFWSVLKIISDAGIKNDSLEWIVGLTVLFWGGYHILQWREKIFALEKRSITLWTFIIWGLLGIILIRWHSNTNTALTPFDVYFLAYSVLLTDSYFDFKDAPYFQTLAKKKK